MLASLNDAPFDHGYVIGTDPAAAGGDGGRSSIATPRSMEEIMSATAARPCGNNGQINAVIPAHGFVVFEKVS